MSRRLGKRWLLCVPVFTVLAALSSLGCSSQESSEGALPTAEVGVFFGGQVQRLTRVEVSRVRPPKLGFRVHLPESRGDGITPIEVQFEVVRPGPAGRRVTRKGRLVAPLGERQVDQLVELDEASRLGVWNIRVTAAGKILADRALHLTVAPGPI